MGGTANDTSEAEQRTLAYMAISDAHDVEQCRRTRPDLKRRIQGIRAESDWDFLVVVPDASPASSDPLVPWRLYRDTGVRADVVVYSSQDFEAERTVPNTLAYEAASTGVALYER